MSDDVEGRVMRPLAAMPGQMGSAAPMFSIVIPVRNRPALLRRALRSVRLQTFRDFEVVVVDDGSSEPIGPVVADFGDLAIRLIRTEGRGGSAARNVGTDAAAGLYVAYLDSDDAFLPAKLEIVDAALAEEPAPLLVSSVYVWRGDARMQVKPARGPRPSEDIAEYYFVADQRPMTSGVVIRADLARAVRWDETLRKMQDPDFVIRAVQAVGLPRYIDEPLAVLYDDTQQGRVSSVNAEESIRAWLDRGGCDLTAPARTAFEVYVLSYEAAKTSRMAGLRLILRRRSHQAPFRLRMKALARAVLPLPLFKAAAQWTMILKGVPPNDAVASYLHRLETGDQAA